jgi:hypothetical protein
MIRLKNILTESFTIDSVTFTPKTSTGGPIIIRYRGYEQVYHVTVDTLPYDGPLAVTKMWESEHNPGTYFLRDNEGHQKELNRDKLLTIARQLKAWPKSVQYKSATIDITLTKHHD